MRAGWDTSPRKWTEATWNVVTSRTPVFLNHLGIPDRSASFCYMVMKGFSVYWPSVKLWLHFKKEYQTPSYRILNHFSYRTFNQSLHDPSQSHFSISVHSHSILIHTRYRCASITSPTCIRKRSKEIIAWGAQVSLRTLQSDERGSKRSDEPTTCHYQYQPFWPHVVMPCTATSARIFMAIYRGLLPRCR